MAEPAPRRRGEPGNTTVDLRPVVVDPQHDLSFAVSPARLQLPAGGRDVVMVTARARRPKLVSKSSDRAFCLSLVPAAPDTQSAGRRDRDRDSRDIHFEQISVLPRKLTALTLFIALVAGVVGAALLMLGAQISQWF